MIILTFHGIGLPSRAISPEEESMWIRSEVFEKILQAIDGNDEVSVMFDDGNSSDIELAMPALKHHRRTATFFVLADRLNKDGSLGPQDLQSLRDEGMQIGVHGMRHRAWPECSEAELYEELVVARESIEDALGEAVTEAACPFGAYNRKVLQHLRDLGYGRVYTSDRGQFAGETWLTPRNTVRASDTPETIQTLCQSPWAWPTRLRQSLQRAVKARL